MKSTLFIFIILLLVGAAQAQQSFVAASPVPNAPNPQKFWSRENKVDFLILAAQITVDAITTQRGLSEGFRESNPVMRPLVTSEPSLTVVGPVVGCHSGPGAIGVGFHKPLA